MLGSYIYSTNSSKTYIIKNVPRFQTLINNCCILALVLTNQIIKCTLSFSSQFFFFLLYLVLLSTTSFCVLLPLRVCDVPNYYITYVEVHMYLGRYYFIGCGWMRTHTLFFRGKKSFSHSCMINNCRR